MPTVTVDAFLAGSEERGDLHEMRIEQGTNRYGLPSHATACREGARGHIQYGFRSQAYMPHASLQPVYNSCTPHDPAEGPHECNAYFIFKDLGVPQGTTVTNATLSLWRVPNSQVSSAFGEVPHIVGATNDYEWRLKVYGIAEDNVVPARSLDAASGYEMKYQDAFYPNRWDPRWAGRRRTRYDSCCFDREHTSAKVNWRWTHLANGGGPFPDDTRWNAPDIASVITEIVGRSGWSPNNRLGLVLAVDDMLPGANYRPFVEDDLLPENYWGPGFQCFLFWAGAGVLVPSSYKPRLSVTW